MLRVPLPYVIGDMSPKVKFRFGEDSIWSRPQLEKQVTILYAC